MEGCRCGGTCERCKNHTLDLLKIQEHFNKLKELLAHVEYEAKAIEEAGGIITFTKTKDHTFYLQVNVTLK